MFGRVTVHVTRVSGMFHGGTDSIVGRHCVSWGLWHHRGGVMTLQTYSLCLFWHHSPPLLHTLIFSRVHPTCSAPTELIRVAPLSACEILLTHNQLSHAWIYNLMKRSVVSIGIRKTP